MLTALGAVNLRPQLIVQIDADSRLDALEASGGRVLAGGRDGSVGELVRTFDFRANDALLLVAAFRSNRSRVGNNYTAVDRLRVALAKTTSRE